MLMSVRGPDVESIDLLNLIKEHTFKCIGCTDPLAIALAAASAYAMVGGKPLKVDILVDRNVYKDALSVGIPGGFGCGPELAAAAGVVVAKPERGLLQLSEHEPEKVAAAESLVRQGMVRCSVDQSVLGIYIKAVVSTDLGEGTAIIQGSHDNIVSLRRNGEDALDTIHKTRVKVSSALNLLDRVGTIEEVVSILSSISHADLDFLLEAVDINMAAAAVGIHDGAGLAVGKTLMERANHQEGYRGECISRLNALADIMPLACAMTAGAADARMAGLSVPIVGCFGSGNHGIMLFITLGLLARRLSAPPQALAQALAVGSIFIALIKRRTGILTPHCGCALAAGVGVAGGAAYLLWGDTVQSELAKLMDMAASLVIADIFGVVCDGAKPSCALKISTATTTALQCTYLAKRLSERNDDWHRSDLAGIGGRGFWEALIAIERITSEGFCHVDHAMLRLLQDRQRRNQTSNGG